MKQIYQSLEEEPLVEERKQDFKSDLRSIQAAFVAQIDEKTSENLQLKSQLMKMQANLAAYENQSK